MKYCSQYDPILYEGIIYVENGLLEKNGEKNMSGLDDYVYVRKADNTNGWIIVLTQTDEHTAIGWVGDIA